MEEDPGNREPIEVRSMNTVNVLCSSLQVTHEDLVARFDRASTMRSTPGQPRKGYEHIDTFLAVASKHLNAVDAVLLPEVRRAVPDGDHLVHEYVHATKTLELVLAHLKAREYGSVFDAARSWSSVWSEVGAALSEHRHRELELGELLAVRSSDAALDALAHRLHRAESAAPTRPHPYTPHTGFPGLVARRLMRTVDSFWDAVEGRMAPDPPRPPHKAPGKVTQYFLADPHFDKDNRTAEHPPPHVSPDNGE
jgi:hypothetical protein